MGENLANAPLKFAPADGVAFFETLGWKACDIREIFQEAVRFRRVRFSSVFSPFYLSPIHASLVRPAGRQLYASSVETQEPLLGGSCGAGRRINVDRCSGRSGVRR